MNGLAVLVGHLLCQYAHMNKATLPPAPTSIAIGCCRRTPIRQAATVHPPECLITASVQRCSWLVVGRLPYTTR